MFQMSVPASSSIRKWSAHHCDKTHAPSSCNSKGIRLAQCTHGSQLQTCEQVCPEAAPAPCTGAGGGARAAAAAPHPSHSATPQLPAAPRLTCWSAPADAADQAPSRSPVRLLAQHLQALLRSVLQQLVSAQPVWQQTEGRRSHMNKAGLEPRRRCAHAT